MEGPGAPANTFVTYSAMATTVHIPADLLSRIDRRAAELGVRWNRYIVRALEKAVEEETSWSPRFLDALADAEGDDEGRVAVDEMMREVAARRTRKRPARL